MMVPLIQSGAMAIFFHVNLQIFLSVLRTKGRKSPAMMMVFAVTIMSLDFLQAGITMTQTGLMRMFIIYLRKIRP